MKNLGFIAVMALLMMFGCSMEDETTSEQELFSVEKNSQPVIYGEKGPQNWNNGVGSGINFKGTSSDIDGSFKLLHWCENDDEIGVPILKILTHGNFSGKLIGYGKINEIDSYYDVTVVPIIPDNNLFGTTDYFVGLYFYNIEIIGTVFITDRDSSNFTFTLSGNYKVYYDSDPERNPSNQAHIIPFDDINDMTGEILNSSTKFDNLRRTLNGSIWFKNLTTGEITLWIN